MSKIGSMAWKTMVGLLTAGCVAALAEGREVADLVLTGGKVVTVDEARPRAEAVAIRGDRIEAVGSVEEIARYTGPGTRVIELAGKLVLPGFIEGHGHFLGLGQSKMMLDASLAATWEDLVHQVATAARDTPEGEWIVGRGWHQSKWTRPPSDASG
jgi:predicted amidohydrolase YtcJ